MSKIILAVFLAVVAAAMAENEIRAFMCTGFYSCDNCCEGVASGCKKTSDYWRPQYMEVCRCSCPQGTAPPQRSDIVDLKDIFRA